MRDRTFDEASRRLSVSYHHDLLHVFALCLQEAPRQPQTLGGVRVIWTNLRRRELCQRQFFSRVMKQNDFQRIARVLRANQMTKSQRDFLCGRKPVFTIEN